MSGMIARDVEYHFNETRMSGHFVAPSDSRTAHPGVLIVHDAWGLTDEVIEQAHTLSAAGFAVFCADAWGDRFCPSSEEEIGKSIGGMMGDRAEWIGRITEAFRVFASQPEVDPEAIAGIGYCFGGASVLEYVRAGGKASSIVSIHGGLDLLADNWDAPSYNTKVLVCTGFEDPMATEQQRTALQTHLSAAGISWEVDMYSHTVHAFTSPRSAHSPRQDLFAYNPVSAERAWSRTVHFLKETLVPAGA